MAPLTKDAEVASPASNTATTAATTPTKTSSGMRSDAVSLEVAVKVHGSRVTDKGPGAAPHTEPFEEQTVTMIVFPQGAVIRMSTAVNVSQMLVLTNIKTKQDSICRVLKVRPNSNQGSYVEVEFTHRQPGYWGLQFPSENTAPVAAAPAPQVVAEPQPVAPAPPAPASVAKPPAPTPIREAKPAASVPPAPAAQPKPESPFASFGTKEEVQAPASATATLKPLTPVERRIEQAASMPKNVSPAEAPSAPLPSLSMDELLGDPGSTSAVAPPESVEEPAAASAQEHHEPIGAANMSASNAAAADSFGARLDSSFGAAPEKHSGSNQNWMLIAACVAVLVAGLGGGIAYFRQRPANPASSAHAANPNAASAAQSSGTSASQLPAITPAGQSYVAASPESSQPARSSVSSAPAVAAPAPAPSSVVEAKTSAPNSNRPAPQTKPAPGVTSDMVSGALTARPTTSARGDDGQSVQAPTLEAEAAAPGANALSGITASSGAALPPPEMRPEGPVKIGGHVDQPKLISSVTPQYPAAARASGTQGDVVIATTIDKSGSVVKMHVVSGPVSLRAAAMDALRRWKYSPSLLDGQPTEVQMQVTIKFRI